MDKDNINIVFADNVPPSFDSMGTLFKSITEPKRSNAGSTVLFIVAGLLSIFLVGNYVLFIYTQKSLPPRKKKPVSAKKMKREKLKNGVSPLGE